MLAEGFLTGFQYEEGKYRGKHKKHNCKKKRKDNEKQETWKDQLVDASASDEVEKQNKSTARGNLLGYIKDQQGRRPEDEQRVPAREQISSPALQIVRRDRNNENLLDLYTSWSCTSIYKNYPDLHIGGDHIGNISDSGCILDHECEISEGPVLLSIDIPLGHSPCSKPLEKPSIIKLLQGDENRDRSFMLQNRPFSNSMLNCYMEKHVDELYKQYFEENLTMCGSPSSLLLNNAAQISLQISQEQNMEACRARDMLLHHLRSAASKNSSEFTTPVLQISNFEGKNSDSFAKKISRVKQAQ
ncbi:uncharacterized protein CXorf21-like [Rhinatrema bivittatum]|uniref:uncharacterized protein CXorf21-like n=1 Tax=Rhinatrema bivittatum TaxID=194408 RepID=UPI0011299311|nr:uncharacterized protein CXorf21-like [Rhinatrema bivittatum]